MNLPDKIEPQPYNSLEVVLRDTIISYNQLIDYLKEKEELNGKKVNYNKSLRMNKMPSSTKIINNSADTKATTQNSGKIVQSNIDIELDNQLCRLATGYTRKELLEYPEEDTGMDKYDVRESLDDVDRYRQNIKQLINSIVLEVIPEKMNVIDKYFNNIKSTEHDIYFRQFGYNKAIDDVCQSLKEKLGL